jgi:integrase/recombinase XerD
MTNKEQKQVGISNTRQYTNNVGNITFKVDKMAKQAKTLTQQEFRRVLDYITTRKHIARNRAMLFLMFYAGTRVGETSALRIEDAVDADGNIKREILLKADITKGNVARTIYVSDKLYKELDTYIKIVGVADRKRKLFYSQKRTSDGFSPNTLTQYWHYLFSACGIDNASSHSMRRSFATQISSKGVGIRVLQKLMGHKSAQTTMVYIDASDDMLRKAVELV